MSQSTGAGSGGAPETSKSNPPPTGATPPPPVSAPPPAAGASKAGDKAGATKPTLGKADPKAGDAKAGDAKADKAGPKAGDKAGGGGDLFQNPSPKAKIGIAAFVAINLLIIGVLIFSGGGDDETAEQGSDTSTPGPTAAIATDSGTGDDGETTGTTVKQAEPMAYRTGEGIVDTFDREGPGLGTASGLFEWIGLSGTWEPLDGMAMSTGHENFAAYAIFDTEPSNGQLEVTLPVVRDGAGVVFRFQDVDNYWAVRAVPEFGGWHLVKFLNGEETKVADILGEVGDGVRVAVGIEGYRIGVFLNGEHALTIEDPDLAGLNQVGLTIKGPGTTEGRFDDVTWVPAELGDPGGTGDEPAAGDGTGAEGTEGAGGDAGAEDTEAESGGG